ncbi:MAG TPA: GlsB/YeaQ/YmgE family stress response membrane protein [Chloroflexota bacterium]|nr:GlsB/YeaQ/YmgE family stress response membrane protein [Chloroflexota bacterium]
MPLGVLALLVFFAIAALFFLSGLLLLTGWLIALGLHLLVAGIAGALADAVIPGKLPWGWLGAVLAGLLGSWIGVALIGQRGPSLFGVPLIQAFVGALILAAIASVFSKRRAVSP